MNPPQASKKKQALFHIIAKKQANWRFLGKIKWKQHMLRLVKTHLTPSGTPKQEQHPSLLLF